MKTQLDIIDIPKDRSAYIKAPANEDKHRFIINLIRLLQQGTANIETDNVDLDWVNEETVMQAAAKNGYKVSMHQTEVNMGQKSTCSGIFFFQRKSYNI